ncbi:hypothetical protein G7085_03005 [Tessaracoccus sp. HDW20]|uniref:hypothetical protein n=1 Tax=Tessaracoccus coleopterorum TaxID=2714950 RepID=UPI0018D3D7DA|nr:hypothetical protein [Tessaracoccus coleopterorum]NHB83978.1 hypothetical protein [Tessaracoccus coleopterorum]
MRFSYHPLNPVMIAVAVWLSLAPLDALVDPGAYSLQSLPLLVASAVVGLGLALLRAPRPATLLAQLAAVLGVLVWRGLALAGPGDPVTSVIALTRDGMEIVRTLPRHSRPPPR